MQRYLAFAIQAARGARLASVALVSVLALAACGGDGPTAPAHEDVAGNWVLEFYEGAALPVVLSEGETCVVRLVEGSLDFSTATRVRLRLALETACVDEEVLVQQTGGDFIYEYADGALELTEPGQNTPSLTGTVTVSTLTITDGNTTLAFRR